MERLQHLIAPILGIIISVLVVVVSGLNTMSWFFIRNDTLVVIIGPIAFAVLVAPRPEVAILRRLCAAAWGLCVAATAVFWSCVFHAADFYWLHDDQKKNILHVPPIPKIPDPGSVTNNIPGLGGLVGESIGKFVAALNGLGSGLRLTADQLVQVWPHIEALQNSWKVIELNLGLAVLGFVIGSILLAFIKVPQYRERRNTDRVVDQLGGPQFFYALATDLQQRRPDLYSPE